MIRRDLRFGDVAVDARYGKAPAFLRGIDQLHPRFVADVHRDQTISLQNPDPNILVWKGPNKRPRQLKAQSAALRAVDWVAAQPQSFFIEHAFRGANGECGLADYPVLRWDAWHHRMALVMLATLFSINQKFKDANNGLPAVRL